MIAVFGGGARSAVVGVVVAVRIAFATAAFAAAKAATSLNCFALVAKSFVFIACNFCPSTAWFASNVFIAALPAVVSGGDTGVGEMLESPA